MKKVITIYMKEDVRDLIPLLAKKLHNEGYAGMFDSLGEANKSGVINALLLIAGGKKHEVKRIPKNAE
jgi:hypothetical protein